ncbi:hypothetical protein NP233_g1437 [Leucocoprinus birnbaumii]|uniref:Cytochrome b5 heme-binding domain-containing protein n=1 Tax=Leucocoprinus birnbaumii TaxID=56174 RepID=A0AAD5W033_9AGAR|nr:hypothetical protein NP233_g1437 [Leucocoprinus birnbaumii]
MQPPKKLAPPKDQPFTTAELSQYDGSDPSKPIYVAVQGVVFDVTHRADCYGPGRWYHIYAGKDGSRGLGKTSLTAEDAIADYGDLSKQEKKVLDNWYKYFLKRYNVIGRVIDGPQVPESS